MLRKKYKQKNKQISSLNTALKLIQTCRHYTFADPSGIEINPVYFEVIKK